MPKHLSVTNSADLIRAYRLDQERRGLMPSTVQRRCEALRTFSRWLGRDLLEASREDVERFLDARKLGSRARYWWVSCLHCFYAFAQRDELTSSDPTARIIRPKLRRLVPRPASEDDLALALAAVADRQMRAWLLLGALQGLRCAEIAGLSRTDVLDTHRPPLLIVQGKGSKERVMPLHPEVLTALRALPMPSGRLFRRPRGGPYTPARVSREMALFFDGLGLGVTAHQLRHRFGSVLYALSHDLRLVQELLGHSSPTTTSVYTAFSSGDAIRYVTAAGLNPSGRTPPARLTPRTQLGG